MKKGSLLVSVIMPAYNQAPFLSIAIESVLAQTYRNIELIIVDDGSTDQTATLCEKYAAKDSRVHFIKQENRGPSAARNVAIRQSHGNYLCFLDADDLMMPNKIAVQLDVMQQDPSLDVTYTALKMIDTHGNDLGEIHSTYFSQPQLIVQMFFRNVIPNPNTVMVKRICLENDLYNESLKHAEDYDLMMRLVHKYQFKYIDIPLTAYRRHGDNLSNDLQAHRQTELKVLSRYSKEHVEHALQASGLSKDEQLLMKGKIFFNMERWKDALEILEKLSTPLALFYCGNCYLKLHQLDPAARCYEHSLRRDPTNPAAYNNLGVVYGMQSRTKDALNAFQQANKLKPGYLDANRNLEMQGEPQITWRELRPTLISYSNKK